MTKTEPLAIRAVIPNTGNPIAFAGGEEEAQYFLATHHRHAREGRCHKFNGKKYCYHKGQEIVTPASNYGR